MLPMVSLARGNYATLVDFEFVAEEIVRTIVGSLGLIAAVPVRSLVGNAWKMEPVPRSRVEADIA
jgi:uncharacterized membrane protein